MAIQSSAVGADLETRDRDVDVRKALAYAAGIGDLAPTSFEDDRVDGIVAPPSYCVSLEWQVVISGRSRSLLGAAPDEVRLGVHAAQDSTFHRPIRPGDQLRTSGRVVAVEPTAAGALCLTKFETVDRRTAEPVATSWSTSIYRSVQVEGAPERLEEAPPIPRLSELPAMASVEIPIAREMPHVYSECADIWNPIHTERAVALAAGLPDIILHGTATWALAGREIVRRFCDGDPARLRRLHGRFRAMVIPGTSIRVNLGRDSSGAVRFSVLNDRGKEAISAGYAVVV